MKRIFTIIFALLLYGAGSYAQNPVQVVRNFGDALSEWCKTDEINIRIEKLDAANGKISCRVEDEVSKLLVEKEPELLQSNFDLSVYLDGFQKGISSSSGQKFQMSNIQVRPDFVEPTAFSKDVSPEFVSADLALKGYLNCNTTDLYYVRGKNITKIIDFSSDESLGKAISLYSQRKYDDAFRIFRKLAYADFTNFDAQYYTIVMELKNQGCGHLAKKVKDQELAWFIYKNCMGKDENALRLAMRFPLNDADMVYAHFPSYYKWILRFKQPLNSNRMMTFNSKKMKCGFIDEKGKLVIDYKYDIAYPFHEGMSLVVSKVTKKSGFIDKDGNEVIPMKYKNAFWDFYKGRNFCIDINNNAQLIDKNGTVLKTIGRYPYIVPSIPVGEYALLFKTEKLFDVFDYDGNLIYKDCNEWAADSANGIITVKRSGKKIVEYKIEW